MLWLGVCWKLLDDWFCGTAFDGRGHMGSSPNEGPFLAPQIVPRPSKAVPKREPNLEHSPYAVAVLPPGTGMKLREAEVCLWRWSCSRRRRRRRLLVFVMFSCEFTASVFLVVVAVALVVLDVNMNDDAWNGIGVACFGDGCDLASEATYLITTRNIIHDGKNHGQNH